MADCRQDANGRFGGAAPAIHVRNARLRLGTTILFENLSIDVAPGEITCLLGLSGIGKSSLLKLIAGLGPNLENGSVQAEDGKPISNRVAYMDQRDLLLPWLNVLDNVTLGARLRGEPQDRDGAKDLLRDVGLAERIHDRPALLSGGMRQRAALARTLMEDRPIVLMDEPFSALDALTRLQLHGLAGRLLKDRTVLLVTHDPFEAVRFGHRVHVMAGQPAKIDSTMTLSGKPPRDPLDTQAASHYRNIMSQLQQFNSGNAGEAYV
jgi:putative hydroxymethylpyrimidine transport system ATP-binding protein